MNSTYRNQSEHPPTLPNHTAHTTNQNLVQNENRFFNSQPTKTFPNFKSKYTSSLAVVAAQRNAYRLFMYTAV